jgi:predicted permease
MTDGRRWWIRRLLALYPEEFRKSHGQELLDHVAESEFGLVPLTWNLAANAVRLRLEEGRERRRPSLPPLDGLRQDARDAFRSLKVRPAWTAVFLTTLALGIGANAAIFTVLNWVMLRPLAYSEPDRVVRVWWRGPPNSCNQRILALFKDRAKSFAGLSGFSGWGFTLTGQGEPEALSGAVVSTDHFDVLAVAPLIGRTFTAEESEPGRSDVCVLGEGLWNRRFGADESILGKRIDLAGAGRRGCTVIGVVPEAQTALTAFGPFEAFLPLERPADLENDDSWFLSVVGRLAPGATLEKANAEVRELSRLVKETMYPRTSEETIRLAHVEKLEDAIIGPRVKGELLLLAAAVGMVLLLACGNLSTLLIARYGEREREISVRSALGAGRSRVLRQLSAESLLLGLLGGSLGILLASTAIRLFSALLPADIPRTEGLSVDGKVLAFTLLISLASAVLFGLPPALRASIGGRVLALRAGATAPARHRLHGSLVAFQVASCLVLLVAAGLSIQGFRELSLVDPGFEPEPVLVASVSTPDGGYPQDAQKSRLFEAILEKVSSIPGVLHAGAIHILPLDSSNWDFPLYPEGRTIGPTDTPPHANFRVVSGDYFRAMGIPLLQGRQLESTDRKEAVPVAVVNRAFAQEIWPGESALGKKVRLLSPDGQELEIVGVVGDVRQHGLASEPRAEIYRPLAQWTVGRNVLVVQAAGDPASLAASLRQAVWSIDPNLPIAGLSPMNAILSQSIASSRFVTLLLGGFAVLALALAAVGVYGVASSIAGSRRREIGIRMALGSSSTSVLAGVVARGMGPVLPGLAVGLLASAAGSRLLASVVPKTPSLDAPVLLLVAAFLAGVALLACYLPARKASRLDPLAALRLD